MNARDSAAEYLARGWSPIPVPWRSKDPGIKSWPKLRVTSETLGNYFNGANHQNIGILLGEPSGGLADVDSDCPEAVIAGRHLLAKFYRGATESISYDSESNFKPVGGQGLRRPCKGSRRGPLAVPKLGFVI